MVIHNERSECDALVELGVIKLVSRKGASRRHYRLPPRRTQGDARLSEGSAACASAIMQHPVLAGTRSTDPS